MAILFDSVAIERDGPETERVPVPLVLRIPIDVEDVLNDFDLDLEPPITRRGWPTHE